MAYRLALDIGSNSIGWCLVDLDSAGAPCGIRDVGVRVFPDGRDPKTLASLAAARRLARGMRRRRDRYLQRRRALLNALTRQGLMPLDEAARKAVAALDPYALRLAALHRRLEAHELGRVIFHLNQRRGFQSNRKADRANDADQGKIKAASDALKVEIARAQMPTLGAWLAARHQRRDGVRARLIGSGAKAAYPFYPTRDLIRAEFDTIWVAQADWNPTLTPAMRDEIVRVLFHQRPLRDPLVGRCWLENNEFRASKAMPSTQTFRIAQDLAHLVIRSVGEPDQPLNIAQRASLAAKLAAGGDLSFNQLRKALGLVRGETFNLESRARDKLKGAETAARLAGKNKPLAAIWPRLSPTQRDDLVRVLLDAPTSTSATAALVTLGIPADLAEQVERVTLPDGHAALSTKAMLKILPHLEAGLTYDKAVQAAGYAHHSDDRDGVIHERLPYYAGVLADRLGTGTGDPQDTAEKQFGRVANPTVHVALNQVRHLVNAILARHGHPAQIVVEVLRELNQSGFERRRIEKEQAENAKRREAWAQQLRALGQRVNGRNLALMRLWSEQSGDPKERICPYTGVRISLSRLFSGEVEEDHILPFAITLDDSFANRLVVTREANRRKSRQTPYEAFHASPDWQEIQARAAVLPPAKAWRFAPDALEKWKGEHGDFLARHLTDSAYIARLARLYLRAICDPDQVYCVPGRLTALLRGALGLNSASLLGKGGARKERNDHRHHAIDALTVALIDRSLLQRVATAAGRAEQHGRRLLDDIGEPWPHFIAEAAACVQRIVVSFKPDTAASGQLHNDTAYGNLPDTGLKAPNVAHRVPVQALAGWSPKDVRAAIADLSLATGITQSLAKTEGKAAQAAALGAVPHDSAGRTVRRVRVRERLEGTAEIKDRRTGRPYKRVKLDANHRVEFWRLPPRGVKPAKVQMIVVPMLRAAMDAEAKRLRRAVPDRRPHPAAKLLVRLHKDDVVAFGIGEARRLLRVVKFSEGELTLADLHEAGPLKARNEDKDDRFRYVRASPSLIERSQTRKVFIDPAGRVFDPGPLAW